VNILGTGLTPLTQEEIVLNGKPISMAFADDHGSFTKPIEIPAMPGGISLITAIDQDGSKRWLTLNVASSISLSKVVGEVGAKIMVKGTAYDASSIVSVKYDNSEIGLATTDDTGNFSFQLTVPVSPHGPHLVTATDDINTKQISYTVESTPPDIPFMLTPENGTKVTYPATFRWEGVYDISQPVVYMFEISRAKDFNEVLISKGGISVSEYTLTAGEKLLANRFGAFYYWRVNAIDGASNISPWSTPSAFDVAPEHGLPFWAKWLLGVSMVAISITWLVFLLRGLSIIRRHNRK